MSDTVKFINGLKKQISAGIHVAMLARIVRFEKWNADIQPLESGLPLLVNVPVLVNECENFDGYKTGDIILAIVVDYAPDNIGERHQLQNAVVVGRVQL